MSTTSRSTECAFSSFKRKGNLRRHIISRHRRLVLRCNHCNATYTEASHVATHLRKVHNLTAPFRPHYSGPEPGPNTVELSTIAHVHTVTQAMALDAVRSAINKVNYEEASWPASARQTQTRSPAVAFFGPPSACLPLAGCGGVGCSRDHLDLVVDHVVDQQLVVARQLSSSSSSSLHSTTPLFSILLDRK